MGNGLKRVSHFIIVFLTSVFIACEREELTPFDLDLQVELLSPDPAMVLTGDSATFVFRLIPDDSLLFDDFRVNGVKPLKAGENYRINLNLAPLRPRFQVLVTVGLNNQIRLADSIRMVAIKVAESRQVGDLSEKRAGHVSLFNPMGQIISGGGVSSYFDMALPTFESFDPDARVSNRIPDFQMITGRTGYAMFYSTNGSLVIAGGQSVFSPGETTAEMNTEVVFNSRVSYHSPIGVTGDFAWSSHGDTLTIHGGRGRSSFQIFRFSGDSLIRMLTMQTGLDYYNHSLTFLPGFPGFLFLESGFFSYGFPLQSSYLVRESDGGFFFSDLIFQDIRIDHTVSAIPGNFLLIAGGYQPGEGAPSVLSTVELADLESARSYRLPVNLITGRFAHSASVSGKSVYFTGGFNSSLQALQSIERLTLDY